MGWDLSSKREIEDLLRATWTAMREMDLRFGVERNFLQGYATALTVVAQGLGVEFETGVDFKQEMNYIEAREWSTASERFERIVTTIETCSIRNG